MPKPVKLITWGTEYSEMLAEMGILEGEQSRFIRLLIDEAYRRFRAGNPVSVVDAMLSDTFVYSSSWLARHKVYQRKQGGNERG